MVYVISFFCINCILNAVVLQPHFYADSIKYLIIIGVLEHLENKV